MDAGRVSRFVRKTKADAWIVCAGSREVLEWFSAQPVPAFALFGRRDGLPIAAANRRSSSERFLASSSTAKRRLSSAPRTSSAPTRWRSTAARRSASTSAARR